MDEIDTNGTFIFIMVPDKETIILYSVCRASSGPTWRRARRISSCDLSSGPMSTASRTTMRVPTCARSRPRGSGGRAAPCGRGSPFPPRTARSPSSAEAEEGGTDSGRSRQREWRSTSGRCTEAAAAVGRPVCRAARPGAGRTAPPEARRREARRWRRRRPRGTTLVQLVTCHSVFSLKCPE